MSREKRTWNEKEKPVKLGFLYSPREPIATNLQCPVCEQKIRARSDQVGVRFVCLCGASLQVMVELRLKELGEEEEKGE